MNNKDITNAIVSNQDITKNIVPTAPNISEAPIEVPAEHTFAPINSFALDDPVVQNNHTPQNNIIKNKTSIYIHPGGPNPKEDIKNPFVIALIVLAAVIVILICVLIPIIVLGKQNTTTTSGTSGGNKGHRKWLALRHHRNHKDPKIDKNKFEHHPNDKNDPSGWQLYLLEGCGYCTKQMEKLNGFNTFAKYSRGNPEPIINNIVGELYPRNKMNGFPLWYNSNTKEVKMGFQENICNLSPKISTANC